MFLFFIQFLMADLDLTPCMHELRVKRVRYWCDKNGGLKQKEKLFANQSTVSVREFYNEGQLVNRKVYNDRQMQTAEIDFEYLSDGSYLKTQFSIDPFRASVLSKEKFIDIDHEKKKLEEWNYEKTDDGLTKLRSHIVFREGVAEVPEWVAVYDDNERFQFWQKLRFDTNLERVVGVEYFDDNYKLLTLYSSDWSSKVDNLETSGLLSDKPLGVVVIDSGFEIDHPLLEGKWYSNPLDVLDGIDNDSNGMVDDVFGYHKFQGGEFSANIQETFKVERVPEEIVSHGTHVAGLAMENITQWSLVGFSGDFTNESFIEKMNQFVTKHAARFVNMSFSFGKSRGMFSPPKASFAKFSQMIQQNPATLFFVAAGNSPYSIDRTKEFPASYDFANTVVVGALEASEFEPVPDLSYAKVAEFSSFGEKNVDVFAPGDNVSSALIGHRYGPKSGTSMATPKALNVVARVSEEYPQFTGAELKHALLLSVYIPDLRTPLPCLSGGVVYEKRLLDTLRLYSSGLSMMEAALQARIAGERLEGESKSEFYLSQLKEFWLSRGL